MLSLLVAVPAFAQPVNSVAFTGFLTCAHCVGNQPMPRDMLSGRALDVPPVVFGRRIRRLGFWQSRMLTSCQPRRSWVLAWSVPIENLTFR